MLQAFRADGCLECPGHAVKTLGDTAIPLRCLSQGTTGLQAKAPAFSIVGGPPFSNLTPHGGQSQPSLENDLLRFLGKGRSAS